MPMGTITRSTKELMMGLCYSTGLSSQEANRNHFLALVVPSAATAFITPSARGSECQRHGSLHSPRERKDFKGEHAVRDECTANAREEGED